MKNVYINAQKEPRQLVKHQQISTTIFSGSRETRTQTIKWHGVPSSELSVYMIKLWTEHVHVLSPWKQTTEIWHYFIIFLIKIQSILLRLLRLCKWCSCWKQWTPKSLPMNTKVSTTKASEFVSIFLSFII